MTNFFSHIKQTAKDYVLNSRYLLPALAYARRIQYYRQCSKRDLSFGNLPVAGSAQLYVHKSSNQKGMKNILWVGADNNQDSLGFLDELGNVARVAVFTNEFGESRLFYDGARQDSAHRNAVRLLDILVSNTSIQFDVVAGQFWPELIELSYPPLQKYLSDNKIKVLCIAMDDFMPGRWLPGGGYAMAGPAGFGNLVDLYATSDVDSVQRYHALGLRAVYMPFGCSESIRQRNYERDIDVVFVGSNYGARRKLISDLIAAGINLQAYGPGFPNGHVTAKKIMELYSRAKIVLGVCNVGYQTKERNLKTRDFDAISAGALYVANACSEFNRFFAPGMHYVHYTRDKDLLPKLRYCLDNPAVSREIAERAYTLGIKKYLWRDIWAGVLDLL